MKTKKPPTEEQYRRAENQLLRDYGPPRHPCAKCGWPCLDGYCCTFCGDGNPREKK